jgi:hypothetical protein
LPENEREALRRFYTLEQSPERICRDLILSDAQFREITKRVRERYRTASGKS